MAKIQCSFGWEMKKWGDKKIERGWKSKGMKIFPGDFLLEK